MTAIISASKRQQFAEYIDGRGTSTRVETRYPATVLSVTGEVDASNAECVTAVIDRVAVTGRPVIIDLSTADFVGAQMIRAVFEFDDRCRRADVAWFLVAPAAVHRMLRVIGGDRSLPAVESVGDGLTELRRLNSPPQQPLARVAREKLRC